jgi:hypothetical protein
MPRAAAILLILLLGSAGTFAASCGPPQPQAPGPAAHALNTALSGFSVACGYATARTALHPRARPARAEREAAAQVPAILSVLRRNPDWIFQAKTVSELVDQSVALLRGCGLRGVAVRLESGARRAVRRSRTQTS